MDQDRRDVLNAGLGAGAVALLGTSCATAQPAQPVQRWAPGAPGDFDFLGGAWRIHHRQPKPDGTVDEFDGEATCWTILGGVTSIEELRIPARNFSGMGVRTLDVENRTWREHWMNARSGVLSGEGMPGGFVDGAAIFEGDDSDGEHPIKVRSTWDQVTPTSCRWRQSISRDGGATWTDNWIMDWRRA